MAAYSWTAGNVKLGASGVTTKPVQYGEAGITQGMPVYLKASDGKWYKGDCNASTEAAGSGGSATAVTPGGANDYGFVATEGDLYFDAAVFTAGDVVILGATAGQMNPSSDAASGWNINVIGVAKSVSTLALKHWYSGATK